MFWLYDTGYLNDWSSMDTLANRDAALVIVAFLQDSVCRDSSYSDEILSLCNDITPSWKINLHKHNTDTHRDFEEIESDGHLPESVKSSLDDIQPLAELPWLGKEKHNTEN